MHAFLKDYAYHRQIGHLIGVLDEPGFWTQLVRTAAQLVAFDSWVVLRFSNHDKPQVFIENPTPDGAVDMLFHDYLNGLYLFDPFFVASRERSESGLFLLDQVAPENFTGTDYYRLYFQRNIVADEVQFNCALEGDDTLCFSMGRSSRFTQEEVARLALCAPWIIALMRQRLHFEALREPAEAKAAGNWRDGVERAISKVKGTRLTGREVEIGQLMLSGFSSKTIAARLDISVETVRVHKKHIYTKLDINSQSELFAIFYQAQASQAG